MNTINVPKKNFYIFIFYFLTLFPCLAWLFKWSIFFTATNQILSTLALPWFYTTILHMLISCDAILNFFPPFQWPSIGLSLSSYTKFFRVSFFKKINKNSSYSSSFFFWTEKNIKSLRFYISYEEQVTEVFFVLLPLQIISCTFRMVFDNLSMSSNIRKKNYLLTKYFFSLFKTALLFCTIFFTFLSHILYVCI